jgi:hypothetical protein
MAQVSDRQRRAIEALLLSKSTSEAAVTSGIPRRTIERWKSDPVFQDAYRAASREKLGDTVGRVAICRRRGCGCTTRGVTSRCPSRASACGDRPARGRDQG